MDSLNVSSSMGQARDNMVSSQFMRTSVALSEAESQIREDIQAKTSSEMKAIVVKLKKNQPLSDEDIKYMKLWIVGDAQSYSKMENNFDDWLKEFDRLKDVLAGYESKSLAPQDRFNLRGILQDAVRVAADIGNFLEKKERVGKFEAAIADPANLDRSILVSVLEQKLSSPNY